MGFLSKLREGLGKTRSALMGGIESVMRSFVKIDEDFLEELEEILITSDVGVGASEEIIDELREPHTRRPHKNARRHYGGVA